MTRLTRAIVPLFLAMSTLVAAQTRSGRSNTKPAAPAAPSVALAAACESSSGKGVKTSLSFCDILIAQTGEKSVSMAIPAHTGPATLFFQLHPRYDVAPDGTDPVQAFKSYNAVVAIVGPTGEVIDKVAARGEYRTPEDLFDRLPGSGRGNFKVFAPGPPTQMKITIPANVTAVGIVGLRLVIEMRFQTKPFLEPGTPIAMVSNWRIEYTAR